MDSCTIPDKITMTQKSKVGSSVVWLKKIKREKNITRRVIPIFKQPHDQ